MSYVIYTTDRNERVREVERVATFAEASSLAGDHNTDEDNEWVETGREGEYWGWIPATEWADFKARIDEECAYAERYAPMFARMRRA